MRPFLSSAARTNERCPKCTMLNRWRLRWRGNADVTFLDGSFFRSEYIRVRCRGCGYSFEMQPADGGSAKP